MRTTQREQLHHHWGESSMRDKEEEVTPPTAPYYQRLSLILASLSALRELQINMSARQHARYVKISHEEEQRAVRMERAHVRGCGLAGVNQTSEFQLLFLSLSLSLPSSRADTHEKNGW